MKVSSPLGLLYDELLCIMRQITYGSAFTLGLCQGKKNVVYSVLIYASPIWYGNLKWNKDTNKNDLQNKGSGHDTFKISTNWIVDWWEILDKLIMAIFVEVVWVNILIQNGINDDKKNDTKRLISDWSRGLTWKHSKVNYFFFETLTMQDGSEKYPFPSSSSLCF